MRARMALRGATQIPCGNDKQKGETTALGGVVGWDTGLGFRGFSGGRELKIVGCG